MWIGVKYEDVTNIVTDYVHINIVICIGLILVLVLYQDWENFLNTIHFIPSGQLEYLGPMFGFTAGNLSVYFYF